MPPQQAASLTPYDIEAFHKMTCFLDHDGTVGGALKPVVEATELVALFNAGGPRGGGLQMLDFLVSKGADQLDCVGDVLRDKYARHGFVVVEVLDWSWEFAPAGWLREWGEPNIYVMRRKA